MEINLITFLHCFFSITRFCFDVTQLQRSLFRGSPLVFQYFSNMKQSPDLYLSHVSTATPFLEGLEKTCRPSQDYCHDTSLEVQILQIRPIRTLGVILGVMIFDYDKRMTELLSLQAIFHHFTKWR